MSSIGPAGDREGRSRQRHGQFVMSLGLGPDILTASGPVVIGALCFAALVVWCFAHRRVDYTLAALGLYLGLLDGYVKLRTGSPLTTLLRDVLVIAIAVGVLLRALNSRQPLPIPPLGGLVLAFAAVVFIGLFNPSAPPIAVSLGGARQHLEFVPLFFLGYAFLRQGKQVEKLLLILVLCASLGGIVSYVQSTLTPQEFAAWGPGYSERILGTGGFAGAPRVSYEDGSIDAVRPFGLGSDLGAGAVAAALALPALIVLLLGSRGSIRLVAIPLSIGIALAVATSGTRAALITVGVSVLAFALIAVSARSAGRMLVGLAIGSLLVFGTFQFLGPDNSTTKRAQSITPKKALTTFQDERGLSVRRFGEYVSEYPLGVGVGSSGPAASAIGGTRGERRFDTETEWNFLVVEIGIPGLLIFLALNLSLIALAVTRIRRLSDPVLKQRLAALAAPLFGLLVAGFAGPTTASVPPAPYFWLVAGVLSYWLVTAVRHPSSIVARATSPSGLIRPSPHPDVTPAPSLEPAGKR